MTLQEHARDISRHLVQANAIPFHVAGTGAQQEKVFADAEAWTKRYLDSYGAVFTRDSKPDDSEMRLNTHAARN